MEFQRYVDTTPAFYHAATCYDGVGFACFLLYNHTHDAPERISFADAFDRTINRGYYFFLPTVPDEPQIWAERLAELMGPQVPEQTGIVWCNTTDIHTAGKHNLMVVELDQNSVQRSECQSSWGKYKLHLPAGSTVQIDSSSSESALLWIPPQGLPHRSIRIAFEGKHSGKLSSEASIGDFTNDESTGWNAGLYYFIPDENEILSQYFPVFRSEKNQQILFHQYWDPTDVTRTVFYFAGFSFLLQPDEEVPEKFRIELPAHPQRLRTWLRTDMGRPLYLQPVKDFQNEEARLVFQALPGGGYYLTPAGDFELFFETTPDKDEVHFLLCGLSGTESIGFTPHNSRTRGDVLCFTPDRPAHVIYFPGAEISSGNYSVHANQLCPSTYLSDKFTTSWVTMRRFLPGNELAHGNYYYAQPESSPLFGGASASKKHDEKYFQSGFAGQSDISSLPFYRPASAILKPPSETTCNSFPLTPLSGTFACAGSHLLNPRSGENFNFLPLLEQQVIAPARAEILLRNPETLVRVFAAQQEPQEIQYGTTPQGLLVEIPVGAMQWNKLQLATEVHGDGLSFSHPGANLQSAFQMDKQFLVMSRLAATDTGGFDNEISIEGWPFKLNVPADTQNGSYRNVLLFKFMPGKIVDLAKAPEQWTRAGDFNKDPQDVASWLSEFIKMHTQQKDVHEYAGCETGSDAQDLYAAFNTIINSETWTGILALNVDIGLDQFPDQLKGLLGGIQLSNFYAHHFGIEVSQVKHNTESGKLEYSDPSSLFGLVDYEDYTPNSHTPYDFKVNLLQVLFKNTSIADFRCCISLTLGSLFDEKVKIEPPPQSPFTINLKGSYENHEGVASYSFLGKDQYRLATVDGIVWKNIELSQVQFSTLSQQEKTVYSVFSFWGNIAFHDITADKTGKKEKFDVFSFDALPFSGMQLLMNFDIPATPAGQPELKFRFDPTNTSFISSTPRKLSLAKNFAVKVKGIVCGESSSPPTERNYFPVQAPLTIPTEVRSKWYGLRYDFDLGTAGGLAAQAGFVASLLVCWTSQDNPGGSSITVALQMPNSGGMLQTVVQSVLTLSISSTQFVTNYDEAKQTIIYQLILDNVALKTFGITIPPGGQTDAFLFSSPDPGGAKNSTGWYLAYKKK